MRSCHDGRVKPLSSLLIGKHSAFLWIFVLGTCLRFCLALLRTDLVWPDEHFMTLEPASKLVFNRAYLAWEWLEGYRPWSVPLLYVPVLGVCKLLGISGGLVPIYASRVFTVCFSSLALLKFYEILELLRLRVGARGIAFTAFSLAPAMVLWGATCLADHWLMIFWISLLPALYRLGQSRSDRNWLQCGLLAGLPILIKLQAVLFPFAIGLGFLWQRKKLRKLLFYSGGVCVHFLILGCLDWIAYGRPFYSLWQQVTRGEVISRFYGVAPWFDYFSKLESDQSTLFMVVLLIVLATAALRWRVTSRWISEQKKLLWMVLAPGVVYFIFHSSIPHKETRFLLPVLPSLYVMLAIGLHASPWVANWERRILKWRFPRWVLPGFLSVLASISLFFVLTTPLYLSTVNIAQLEARVYQLHSASGGAPTCLLLLDHNWSWTRGRLILGDGLDVIEKKVSEFSPDEDSACFYAILPGHKWAEFKLRVPVGHWSFVEQAPSGFILLRKLQFDSLRGAESM